MSKVVGIVNATSQRGKAYNICVDDAWYGFGFEEPQFSKGAKVSFDIKMNGKYANVDTGTLKVLEDQAAQASPAKPNTQGMDDRQKSICWQSARNAAIETAKFGVEQGFYSVGTAKAKKGDTFLALVDNLTERYYADLIQLAATGEPPTESATGVDSDELDDEGDE